MSNTRFWKATERAADDFCGRGDVGEFRRRLARLGHPDFAIREQVETIHPHLLPEFDQRAARYPRKQRITP